MAQKGLDVVENFDGFVKKPEARQARGGEKWDEQGGWHLEGWFGYVRLPANGAPDWAHGDRSGGKPFDFRPEIIVVGMWRALVGAGHRPVLVG